MRLENASEYDPAAFAVAFPDIVRCLKVYTDRFPQYGEPWDYLDEVAAGRMTLWVVRDDENRIVIAFVTALERVNTTGALRFTMMALGGEQLADAMAVLPELEAWADARGATEKVLVGRRGWQRLLEKHGYGAAAVVYRKT